MRSFLCGLLVSLPCSYAFMGPQAPHTLSQPATSTRVNSVSTSTKVGQPVLETTPELPPMTRTERGQKLRVLSWLKQAKSDLTTAEFALSLSQPGQGKPPAGAIDFYSIADKIEKTRERVALGRLGDVQLTAVLAEEELAELSSRMERVMADINRATAGVPRKPKNDGSILNIGGLETTVKDIKDGAGSAVKDIKDVGSKVPVPEFDLFVREDGTVDWDGAIQSGREVAKFGQELWERINGQDPHEEEFNPFGAPAKTGPSPDPESVTSMIPREQELDQMVKSFEGAVQTAREELRAARDSQVARQLRVGVGLQQENLERARNLLRLHRVDMDMERIACLIEQDIKEGAGVPRENKLLVAEFGLLDAQLQTFASLASNVSLVDFQDGAFLDDAEIELVEKEVSDLKLRLGLELESPKASLDGEKAYRYCRDAIEKAKEGIDFYVTGTKLLGGDLSYGLSLVSKAASGLTLSPREVRTLRRTIKDVLTLIPFTAILITPLSPVGHVLVFSFIQRFYPDFFPSTYTDRRQNLLKMYEEVEQKADQADGSDNNHSEDPVLEKLRRKFLATLNKTKQ